MNAEALPATPSAPAPDSATSPSAPVRIASLDGLRAIAMLMVVAMHYYTIIPASPDSRVHGFFTKVTSLGYTGVDLFFVLSGYLIGGILLDHRTSARLLPAFYARRAFRILPVYFALLATLYLGRQIPGLNATNQGQYFFSRIPDWCYFVFVQNIAIAWIFNIGPYWLITTWSLAVEEQFYLIAPVFIRTFSMRWIAACCGLVILLSPVVRLYALNSAQNPLAALYLLATHADGLMWGVLCACVVRNASTRAALLRRGGLLATLAAGGGLFFLYASARQWGPVSPQMLGGGYSGLNLWFAALVVALVLFPQSWAAQRLAWRPLAAIGITSYFSYLFHFPLLLLLHWLFFQMSPQYSNWQTAAVSVLALTATLTAAWASGRWFDGPLTRLGRRFSYE